ncbi:hypothetical protein QPL79_08555 [Ignisphaera sp. 4213-co]|uniref:Uncharacterized protein n=1 Tax=Ignisphaera cupida TaxID=3050454 RepID=A0ABD4Z8Q4_9CREN|nr:hypothetical protein [Ignisphaera sp. 4213-co]MDK6029412.1 hypothetical protein [Ignisphaera sp. 4213-co]
MSAAQKSITQKYPGIVEIFKKLAENKRYGPIDRLARALTADMVRIALYDALRVGVTEGWALPSDAEVDAFLNEVEKNLGIAQKIAAIALTSASKLQSPESGSQ